MDYHPFWKMVSKVLRGQTRCAFISAVAFLAYASNALDSIPIVTDRIFF